MTEASKRRGVYLAGAGNVTGGLSALADPGRHFAQLYGERVFVPVLKIEIGLPRLRALFERWLDWTIASGLPGGCIMISAANEYDDRPGPIRDAVIATQHRGTAITRKAVLLAVEEGHLRPDTDAEQIAFDVHVDRGEAVTLDDGGIALGQALGVGACVLHIRAR